MEVAIETVFFDAGGVLIHPNWKRASVLVERYGLHVSAERLAAADPLGRREIDRAWTKSVSDGTRARTYLKHVLLHAGLPASPAVEVAAAGLYDEHQRVHLWDAVAPEARPVLGHLAAAGLRLVLVSNSNGSVAHVFRALGLAAYFHCLIDSTEVGVEKPDPRIFRIAMAASGARPETTVHVGDLYHVDVEGARAAGIPGWLLDPAGLYADHDCPRLASLLDLPGAILEATPGTERDALAGR